MVRRLTGDRLKRMDARRIWQTTPAIMLAIALSACATSAPNATSSIDQTQLLAKDGGSDADCKQLTGLMQVRILEARGAATRVAPSGLSEVFQSSLGNLFGAPAKRPATQRASTDRAQLDAENQRLVAAGCRSFDLDRDLTQPDAKLTPTPTVAAPKSAVTAASQLN